MAYPFSPAAITFRDHGIDDRRAVWARFQTAGMGSPTIVVPVADLNVSGQPELWRCLGEIGIRVSSEHKKAIIDKFRQYDGRHGFKLVKSLGWSLGYVHPHRVFGAPSSIVERDFSGLDLRKFRSAGSLEDWQQNIPPLCTDNSRLMFAVMCAFAGPILRILGISGFGFMLVGASSIGKSITLILGGSVYGCRTGSSSQHGFTEKFTTTLDGVERFGRIHNDSLLPLDDTRLAGNDHEIGKLLSTFIMRLAEGVEKNRLVSMGFGDWQVVCLGSSNSFQPELFAAGGLPYDDAYRGRFPDLWADAGCGYGIFETIHGFNAAKEFAIELSTRARTYFGTAGEVYLERLATNRHYHLGGLVAGLQRAIARYRTLVPPGSEVDGRITDLFAVVYAAAVLARSYGILNWTPEQIEWAVRTCHEAHHHASAQFVNIADPVAAVRGYISTNLPQFRQVPDPAITEQDFAASPGFIYRHGDVTEYLIPKLQFERAFAVLKPGRVLQALQDAGFLIHSGSRLVSKAPIRNSQADGREYVYRLHLFHPASRVATSHE